MKRLIWLLLLFAGLTGGAFLVRQLQQRSADFSMTEQTLEGIEAFTTAARTHWRGSKLTEAERDVTQEAIQFKLFPVNWLSSAGLRHPFGGSVLVVQERRPAFRQLVVKLPNLDGKTCSLLARQLSLRPPEKSSRTAFAINDSLIREDNLAPAAAFTLCNQAENSLHIFLPY